MKHDTIRKMQMLTLAAAIASATPAILAQQIQQPNAAQAQTAPAAQSSFCGNQPLCYESTDFAATITQFRTSADGYGNRFSTRSCTFKTRPISS